MTLRAFKPSVVVSINNVLTFTTLLPQQGPRIAFRVMRSITSAPDQAEVAIYNLERTRRRSIETFFGELSRAKLAIQAGYDGIVTQLFRGDVRRPFHGAERIGSDLVTRIPADDAGDAIADTRFSTPISSAGMTASVMVQKALAAFAFPPPFGAGEVIVEDASVAATLALSPRSASTFAVVAIGSATDLLDEAARLSGARWWIRDNQLFMSSTGLPVGALAVTVPRENWITEPSEDGEGSIRLSTFLDPLLTPGRKAILIGREFPGVPEVFRVQQCTYSGDTDIASPWRCDMSLNRVIDVE